MELDIYAYVVRELRARGRSEWPALSEASGVPESTVEKIAYGVTSNPGVHAVQALARTLMTRPGTQPTAAGVRKLQMRG